MITRPRLIPVTGNEATTPPDPNRSDSTIDTLARTLCGEARGEGQAGMEAVAAVIMNRLAVAAEHGGQYWWGSSTAAICQRPWQFSCWNEGDPNRPQLEAVAEDDLWFASALRIARRAAHGLLADPTGGATHYHHHAIVPSWTIGRRPSASIGRHLFYRLVD